MLVALVITLMIAIALYEVPIMLRLGEKGELAAFAALWVAGAVLGVLQTVGYPLPNPTTWIVETMPRIVETVAAAAGF